MNNDIMIALITTVIGVVTTWYFTKKSIQKKRFECRIFPYASYPNPGSVFRIAFWNPGICAITKDDVIVPFSISVKQQGIIQKDMLECKLVFVSSEKYNIDVSVSGDQKRINIAFDYLGHEAGGVIEMTYKHAVVCSFEGAFKDFIDFSSKPNIYTKCKPMPIPKSVREKIDANVMITAQDIEKVDRSCRTVGFRLKYKILPALVGAFLATFVFFVLSSYNIALWIKVVQAPIIFIIGACLVEEIVRRVGRFIFRVRNGYIPKEILLHLWDNHNNIQ